MINREDNENYEEEQNHSFNKFTQESRSLYVGHLAHDTNYYDLCKVAHPFGPLELVRLVPRKRCAFLNFVDINDARKLMKTYSGSHLPHPEDSEDQHKVLKICGKVVRLSWSGTRELSVETMTDLRENGASRNLFVFYGNCGIEVSPQDLASTFQKFGNIENIVVKSKKNIAFINMTSLASSIEIVKKSKVIERLLRTLGKAEDRLDEEYDELYLKDGYLVAKYSTEENLHENYTLEKYNPRHQPFNWNQPIISRNPYYGISLVPSLLLQEKEIPLPPGWMFSFDEKTGCKYFYNSQKNITQWEHPITGKASPPVKASISNFLEEVCSRALHLHNLPQNINYAKLCTLGRQHGLIESVRIILTNKSAFINYVDKTSALSLYSLAQRVPIAIDGFNLKITWAKEEPLEPNLYKAITNDGANRSIYLRDLDSTLTEEDVRIEFERFTNSEIESIVLRPQTKAFGFVNFIDILSAKSVVDIGLNNNGFYTFPDGRTVHVSYVNIKQKTPTAGTANYSPSYLYSQNRFMTYRQPQCRSVIISGFPNDTTNKDIASLGNSFGTIDSLHLDHSKNHAFINFVLPESAAKFMSSSDLLQIRNTQVRVGFGKSVPIKSDILLALEQEGASRIIYVSGVKGSKEEIEEKLKELVFKYCKDDEIETLNINAEKNFAFITLTSIQAAKKIITAVKQDIEATSLKVSYARVQALTSV